MHITPLDIRKQPFRKAFMGFDKDEVNSFLEMVANEFESLIRQNDESAKKLKEVSDRLNGYEKIEKTLNETLITAQKATDEAKVNAQKESELIIKDAQIRADRYEDESRRRVHELDGELSSLKTQRDSFLARFRSLLKDQLSLLDVISRENIKGKRTKNQKTRSGDDTLAEVSPDIDIQSVSVDEENPDYPVV